MEATVLLCRFSWVCCSMFKVLWKNKSPISSDMIEWFCCILLDIHWSYKNMLFWTGIVKHSLSANQIVRCFQLKNFENYRSIKLIFCFHWSCKKYHAILGYDPKIVAQSVCRIFYFWLVWFVNLNIGVHCYIILVFFGLALKYIVVTEYNQSLQ